MRLLWQGRWRDVPAYTPPEQGELLEVELTIPIARLAAASGRSIRSPARKVLTFLATEGVGPTIRKVRAKRENEELLGDYRVCLVLGTRRRDAARVIALCCRVPPCSALLPCPAELIHEVGAGFSEEDFAAVAEVVSLRSERVRSHAVQSYLYSRMRPPRELSAILQGAVDTVTATAAGRGTASAPRRFESVRPDRVARAEGLATWGSRRTRGAGAGPPVALLGAGDYARTQVVPALRKARVARYVVADREPQIAAHLARSGGFSASTTDAKLAIARLPQPGLVVVATSHDSHASLAAGALDAGHRVHLEKPAVVTREDLELLSASSARAPGMLELGFNRRYSPAVLRAREVLAAEQGAMTITCTVREIPLNADHWYFWPNQGTRIAGNLCHWIDLGTFLIGPEAEPRTVFLSPPPPGVSAMTTAERSLAVTFGDGSLLTIVASDRGDDIRGVQETIEVRRGYTTVMLEDLQTTTVLRDGRRSRHRAARRDKGHERMFAAVLSRFEAAAAATYPVHDLRVTSLIQLAATELAAAGGGTTAVMDA